MRFKQLYQNDDLYYCVGVDEDTGQPVIVVTITSIAWRDLYFKLTDEELAQGKVDPHALDDLAQRLAVDKGKKFYADRLLEP